jgi:hypothetical protein
MKKLALIRYLCSKLTFAAKALAHPVSRQWKGYWQRSI